MISKVFAAILPFLIFFCGCDPADAARGNRFPIVFAHGLGAPSWIYEDVVPLKAVFAKLGYDVYVAETPLAGPIEERAQVLKQEIERLVPKGKLHLLGHSMGGLDSRWAISRLGLGDRVASLTTLATPHLGSSVADYALDCVDKPEMGFCNLVADLLAPVLGDTLASVRELSRDFMTQEFNPSVPDDSRVRYFSFAFYIPEPAPAFTDPLMSITHGIMADRGEPKNDGLVSADSAAWGQLVDTLPSDHICETVFPSSPGLDCYAEVFKRVAENLDRNFR